MGFGKKDSGTVTIAPANLVSITVSIEGTAPYVQAKFAEKAKRMIREKHEEGSRSKAKKTRDARDFEADFLAAQHKSEDGWNGIPATAFRSAMIAACRLVDMTMVHARMAVFVEADGFDADDGTPLVRLQSKTGPEMSVLPVRNATGVADLRSRPMWRRWGAAVRITYDADLLDANAVVNLLNRAGLQVGIGEGRPFSKKSDGQGWGTFRVVTD